jgi:hypothetical protein
MPLFYHSFAQPTPVFVPALHQVGSNRTNIRVPGRRTQTRPKSIMRLLYGELLSRCQWTILEEAILP